MNENDLARDMRRYLDGFGPYDRRHTVGVFEELPERRSHVRRRRALALVAGLLGLALAGTLLLSGHRPATAPARQPSATPTTAASPQGAALPAQDLLDAGLTNVAGLVQRVDVPAQAGGRTAHLVGVYADSVRTVFVLDGLTDNPYGGPPLSYVLSDGRGGFNVPVHSGPTPDGTYVSFGVGLTAGADGTDQVMLQVLQSSFSNRAGRLSPAAEWSFAVPARVVTTVRSLRAPASLVVGGRTYRVSSLRETPNGLAAVLFVDNAGVRDVEGNQMIMSLLTLTDPNGASPSAVHLGVAVVGSGVEITATWVRGPAGTYRLTVNGPGGAQNSFQFDVS